MKSPDYYIIKSTVRHTYENIHHVNHWQILALVLEYNPGRVSVKVLWSSTSESNPPEKLVTSTLDLKKESLYEVT